MLLSGYAHHQSAVISPTVSQPFCLQDRSKQQFRILHDLACSAYYLQWPCSSCLNTLKASQIGQCSYSDTDNDSDSAGASTTNSDCGSDRDSENDSDRRCHVSDQIVTPSLCASRRCMAQRCVSMAHTADLRLSRPKSCAALHRDANVA